MASANDGALRIKDWSKHFENHETRKLKRLRWVPVPNKLHGFGYAEILNHPSGAAHLGAWLALLEVASLCPKRGVLRSDTGRNYGPAELQSMTRIPLEVWREAIPRLRSVGWVEGGNTPKSPGLPGESPGTSGESPATPGESPGRREGKGREQNRTTNNPPNKAPPPRGGPSTPDGVAEVFLVYRELRGKGPTKPTEKQRRLIRARLADGCTTEDLVCAIRGNFVDPFCCGRNENNRTYHDLGLILRDVDHVTKYQDSWEQHQRGAPRLNPKNQRTADAARRYLERRQGENGNESATHRHGAQRHPA